MAKIRRQVEGAIDPFKFLVLAEAERQAAGAVYMVGSSVQRLAKNLGIPVPKRSWTGDRYAMTGPADEDAAERVLAAWETLILEHEDAIAALIARGGPAERSFGGGVLFADELRGRLQSRRGALTTRAHVQEVLKLSLGVWGQHFERNPRELRQHADPLARWCLRYAVDAPPWLVVALPEDEAATLCRWAERWGIEPLPGWFPALPEPTPSPAAES